MSCLEAFIEGAPLMAFTLEPELRHILDTISDGVYVTDDEREIVFWSAGAARITGYEPDDVVGKHCYDNVLVHTDLTGKQLCFEGCPLRDCIENDIERTVNEVFLKRKDGERLPVYVKTSVFRKGDRVYGVEVFGELASVAGESLAQQVQELSTSSVTDPLSGLFNRRYFDATLEQHFSMFRRTGIRYGLFHIDIDNFKSINDTLGHSTGDEAIVFVADVIARSSRKMDTAARYGGDEFAVICGAADEESLWTVGRRIVTMIHESQFAPAETAGLHLTVSVGGTLVDSNDPSPRTCLERADEAMYEAKRGGRDGLVIKVLDTA